jgi:hypothetical protein
MEHDHRSNSVRYKKRTGRERPGAGAEVRLSCGAKIRGHDEKRARLNFTHHLLGQSHTWNRGDPAIDCEKLSAGVARRR